MANLPVIDVSNDGIGDSIDVAVLNGQHVSLKNRFDHFERWVTQALQGHDIQIAQLRPPPSASHRGKGAFVEAGAASTSGRPSPGTFFNFDEIEDVEQRMTSISIGVEPYLQQREDI